VTAETGRIEPGRIERDQVEPGRVGPVKTMVLGDTGLLVELDELPAVLALAAAVRAAPLSGPLSGLIDVVPAARTVLLVFAPGTDLGAASRVVLDLRLDPAADDAAAATEPVKIDVVYDGPDLAEVGTLTGLGADGVVAAHTGRPWRVAFGGFAPGFAYLVGGDDRLDVARRAEPRTAVPAGSVGLAGEYSGVYPRSSPGGWQLIGRTDAELWNERRGALLQPGGTVRFRAIR
jgi:KipI family sensor histidine kinase inhibitor